MERQLEEPGFGSELLDAPASAAPVPRKGWNRRRDSISEACSTFKAFEKRLRDLFCGIKLKQGYRFKRFQPHFETAHLLAFARKYQHKSSHFLRLHFLRQTAKPHQIPVLFAGFDRASDSDVVVSMLLPDFSRLLEGYLRSVTAAAPVSGGVRIRLAPAGSPAGSSASPDRAGS